MRVHLTEPVLLELAKAKEQISARIEEIKAEFYQLKEKLDSIESTLSVFGKERATQDSRLPASESSTGTAGITPIPPSISLMDALLLAAIQQPRAKHRGRDLFKILVAAGYLEDTHRNAVKVSHRVKALSVTTTKRESLFGVVNRKKIPWYFLSTAGIERAQKLLNGTSESQDHPSGEE